jgi:glycylpeptide N-tetradecanoyltransferase
MPHGSTKQRQIVKNYIASQTTLPGFRLMEKKDLAQVHNLLDRYLKRFALAQEFTQEEVEHWLFHDPSIPEKDQTVWGYVVEDPNSGKVTDFMTFYRLDSSVIGNAKHSSVKAAYLFYYGSETAFVNNDKALKDRLNSLVADTLCKARDVSFC